MNLSPMEISVVRMPASQRRQGDLSRPESETTATKKAEISLSPGISVPVERVFVGEYVAAGRHTALVLSDLDSHAQYQTSSFKPANRIRSMLDAYRQNTAPDKRSSPSGSIDYFV